MSKRGLVQLKNLFYPERGVWYFEREAKLNFKLEWSFFIPFVCRLSWFIPTAACSRSSPDGLSTMSLCLLLKSSWDRYFEPCYSRPLKSNFSFTNVRLFRRRSFLCAFKSSFARKWRQEWQLYQSCIYELPSGGRIIHPSTPSPSWEKCCYLLITPPDVQP